MSDVTMERQTSTEPSQPREGLFIRSVRFVGWTSIWLGAFLLGFVAHQLFVTTYFAQQNNAVLEAEAEDYFAEAEITEVAYIPADPNGSNVDPGGGSPEAPDAEPRVLFVEEPPPLHESFAIITVPSIERLEDGWAVVEGVTRGDLKNGAGHMTSTPLPGQPGNSVISGHRTTYGAPFHEFEELHPGDHIKVETGLGIHTYVVRSSEIVRPTEIWVTEQRPGAWLTLTTCHPKFSSRQRLVVFAELIDGPNWEAIYG